MQSIILNPFNTLNNYDLRDYYIMAIKDAKELLIVSAYLTDWDTSVKLNSLCSELSFIVGTDFGITRKEACRKVLDWLPGKYKGSFLAADHIAGFHPKVAIWKNKNNKSYAIIGSSNLTQAAFQKIMRQMFSST